MKEKQKRNYDADFKEFVDYLKDFAESDNRAALASLRRGLGKDVGTATEMYRYVFPKVHYKSDESAYFLLASLFGFYPKAKHTDGNLGASVLSINHKSGSIEKRFVALLNSREEMLHEHLRQIIALLRSEKAPVNWIELLKGIKFWSNSNRSIQRSWGRSFWSETSEDETILTNQMMEIDINEGEENDD